MIIPLRLLFAVALISSAALGTEILLLRLFAIVQWQHVASTIVSLALLGYGFSGTVLAVTRNWAEQRFTILFISNAVLFAVTTLAAPLLAQHIPFNTLALFWEPKQILYLASSYALIALPFLFAASAIGLTLQKHRLRPQTIYAADLFGAGIGALASLLLLTILPPNEALRMLTVTALLAAMLVINGWYQRSSLIVLAGIVLLLPHDWTELHISPYKPLSRALTIADAKVIAKTVGPLGMISAVDSSRVPFRYAPGLSLNSPKGPPRQYGLFIDGELIGAVDRQVEENTYLRYLISTLPYALLETPTVLVLGGGDGRMLTQAQVSGALTVEVVERDQNLIDLHTGPLTTWSGNPFDDPGVNTYIGEPRAFVEAAKKHWDLIQVSPTVDSSSIGLSESKLFTVEGLISMLTRTTDGGMVSISRSIRLPPRPMPKLVATAAAALRALGQKKPTSHLIAVRSWQSFTVIIKPTPFTLGEISSARSFAEKLSFDIVWLPGMEGTEANRINIVKTPMFYDSVSALLKPTGGDYVADSKYHLAPATDDTPFFNDFFRWRLLPELINKRGRGGMGLMEWAIPLIAITLLQAAVLSPILIFLPLLLVHRRPVAALNLGRWRILIFFLLLGLGFMAIEMAFIQRYVLFLGDPVLATSVILSGFLIFAGLGSLSCIKLVRYLGSTNRVLLSAATAIVVLIILNLVVFPFLYAVSATWPFIAKVTLGLGLAAPLAFAMGQFFPIGLSVVGRTTPHLIPWAWAINGCASVLGVLLTTFTLVHSSFTIVLLSGAVLYLGALLCNIQEFDELHQRFPKTSTHN